MKGASFVIHNEALSAIPEFTLRKPFLVGSYVVHDGGWIPEETTVTEELELVTPAPNLGREERLEVNYQWPMA